MVTRAVMALRHHRATTTTRQVALVQVAMPLALDTIQVSLGYPGDVIVMLVQMRLRDT